jgi:hypothetical protein
MSTIKYYDRGYEYKKYKTKPPRKVFTASRILYFSSEGKENILHNKRLFSVR